MNAHAIDQAYGGMRGIKGMIWETSVLDADEVLFLVKRIERKIEQEISLPNTSGYSLPWKNDSRVPKTFAHCRGW